MLCLSSFLLGNHLAYRQFPAIVGQRIWIREAPAHSYQENSKNQTKIWINNMVQIRPF